MPTQTAAEHELAILIVDALNLETVDPAQIDPHRFGRIEALWHAAAFGPSGQSAYFQQLACAVRAYRTGANCLILR
jgi:hypothetical protein